MEEESDSIDQGGISLKRGIWGGLIAGIVTSSMVTITAVTASIYMGLTPSQTPQQALCQAMTADDYRAVVKQADLEIRRFCDGREHNPTLCKSAEERKDLVLEVLRGYSP